LRTEIKPFVYPEHYQDARGIDMWQTVQGLLSAGARSVEPAMILTP